MNLPSHRVPFLEQAALKADISSLTLCYEIDQLPRHLGSDKQVSISVQDTLERLTPDLVLNFVLEELRTPLLDALYQYLWIGARKESRHIDAFHVQLIKGRQIMLNEDVKMHLVWTSQAVHIKPIPPCLLNYDFWKRFLRYDIEENFQDDQIQSQGPSAKEARSLALGFLRSYIYLIRYPSDLEIAQEKRLVPHSVNWASWKAFITPFGQAHNEEVAQRYHFGQMRLSRLNFLVRVVLFVFPSSISNQRQVEKEKRGLGSGWFYEPPFWSAGPYFRSITLSLGFFLATISTTLSAMSVSLAAERLDVNLSNIYWTFAILVILAAVMVLTMLVLIPLGFLLWQLCWALHIERNSQKMRG